MNIETLLKVLSSADAGVLTASVGAIAVLGGVIIKWRSGTVTADMTYAEMDRARIDQMMKRLEAMEAKYDLVSDKKSYFYNLSMMLVRALHTVKDYWDRHPEPAEWPVDDPREYDKRLDYNKVHDND